MDQYNKLIVEKHLLNAAIKKEKKLEHQVFVEEHKHIFRTLDLLVVLMVIMNFGAAATTTMLVVKESVVQEVEIEFYEVNPAKAEMNDLEKHPEYESIIYSYLQLAFFWMLLIGLYVYYRLTVFTYSQLIFMSIVIALYFLLYGLDFWNNMGYVIGSRCFL